MRQSEALGTHQTISTDEASKLSAPEKSGVGRRRRRKALQRPSASEDTIATLAVHTGCGVPSERKERYVLVAPLGDGSYGSVWEATDGLNGSVVAIKRVFRQPFSNSHEVERWRRWNRPLVPSHPLDYAERERQLVSSIPPHRNLVRCIAWLPWEAIAHSDGSLLEKPTMPDWALVMERGYPVSSLFDNDRDLLPDLLWLQIIQMIGRALFAALAHLHACGLVHRDVRLDHVLSRQPCSALLAALQTGHVPGPGEFFLCDFSLMRPCTADGASDGADSPTLPYAPVRAPEIFLGDTRRLPSGDIWAAGCVLLEMLLRQAGEPVFDCGYGCSASELRSLTAIFELLGSPGVTLATETNLESEQPRVQIPNDQESSLSKRIAQCWNSDQVRGVLEQAVDLVRHLLDYCGERRLTAAEALEHPFLRDTIR